MLFKGKKQPVGGGIEYLDGQTSSERLRTRDVHNAQQLKRTELEKPKSPFSRIVIAIVSSVAIFVAVWVATTFVFWLVAVLTSMFADGNYDAISTLPPWYVGLLSNFLLKAAISGFAALVIGLILFGYLMKNLNAQNALATTEDINQHTDDQHIAYPEEVQRKFAWFPDAGAHSSVQVSSMISHQAISNKGLKHVYQTQYHTEDGVDKDGYEYLKGEPVYDKDGYLVQKKVPLIDEQFAEDLFDASGQEKDRELREHVDTRQIDYNKGNEHRDRLRDCDTVADFINKDWELPEYEVQRPAGAYLVDTEPVNTMVLAITRAGKGQTIIEPTIDMWMREKRPNNMIINDPKGELLIKNYVPAIVRGFEPIQFNLINPLKTDIYNPLAMAADSAREGDFTKCSMYIENIANVFFPLDGGEDPVWPNAANNAFKRAAYGLIDFYLEEEHELREQAARTNMDPKVLATKIDNLWGHVTLYNCYQLFVRMSSKKRANPIVVHDKEMPMEERRKYTPQQFEELKAIWKKEAEPWQDQQSADLLTVYFNATDMLPRNEMRSLVADTNNALRAMGGAEKMMASVYGIAITAMSFFTDPTISTLTSGTLEQNVDLAGLSFPRRFGVRFQPEWVEKLNLVGMRAVWDCFADKNFTQPLSSEFHHDDLIRRDAWARAYIEGKFPEDKGYLRLRLVNPETNQRLASLYFEFTKGYQTSLDGRKYIKDPVLSERVVKNGILREMVQMPSGEFVYGQKTFKRRVPKDISGELMFTEVDSPVVMQDMVRYSERPKMVFLVTPPHLMKYAKIILILLGQTVNLSFEQSYTTKPNQKPLYKTRFMLDELGNLQSEGHGIENFATMLSIGLGQDQQFTLILQTLEQLRAVYNDQNTQGIDRILQGNTSNITFLKSTDDELLERLSKLSGKRHVTYIDSKSVTRDMEAMVNQNQGMVSLNMTTQEEPVIKYNDLAFLPERNSIVFRASDPPVWNRGSSILPMSWRLFKDTIVNPGHEYSLQTIPTMSTAHEFDVRKNMPDFDKMFEKRLAQAAAVEHAEQIYREVTGRDEIEIQRMDPNVYAEEIMSIVNIILREEAEGTDAEAPEDDTVSPKVFDTPAEKNDEVMQATREYMAKQSKQDTKTLCGGRIAPSDLWSRQGGANHGLDEVLKSAFVNTKQDFAKDVMNFAWRDGSIYSVDQATPYITIDNGVMRDVEALRKASVDPNSRVYADSPSDIKPASPLKIHDGFLKFLATHPDWSQIACGQFERAVARLLDAG